MFQVYSFDVFDTCLTRKVATPSDVFYIAGSVFFSKIGVPPTRASLEDFVAVRIESERTARSLAASEDVTLNDIWALLLRAYDRQFDLELVASELEAEARTLEPVAPMRRRVRTARETGARIIFVSDMYLPSEFIAQQLKTHGFAADGDNVYVSGELGKTKASGSLYKYVLATEKISASSILHTGDHEMSDYSVPLKQGIRTQFFSRAHLTRVEDGVAAMGNNRLTSVQMAGAMRSFRLNGDTDEGDDIRELASQFIAPFVISFARWILHQAREDGVRRLYFMSRDCQLVGKVAHELSGQYGGIECRYLYVSRQALFLPSAESVSPDGMPWMQRSFDDPILKNLLAKLDLRFEDVESEFAEFVGAQQGAFRIETKNDWGKFWELLNKEPIKSKIESLVARRRKDALDYFESAGLFEKTPWAIVDLGWYLTCQHAMAKLLNISSSRQVIRGYYLALKIKRVGQTRAGDSEAIFYERPSDLPVHHGTPAVFSHQTLLEHLVGCADHPSVHHYGSTGRGQPGPVFLKTVSADALKFCRRLHDSVLAFVRQNPEFAVGYEQPSRCRELLAFLSNRFFRFPTATSVRTIQVLRAGVDQNELDAKSIVEPLSLGAALLPLLPYGSTFDRLERSYNCLWPEGARVISSPAVRRISGLARRVGLIRTKIARSYASTR